MHDVLERDIDEITIDSNIISELEGKTPSELDAIKVNYYRKVKESRMQAMQRRRRLMEGHAVQQVYDTCIDVCHFTEELLPRGNCHQAADSDAGHGGTATTP
jgi:hypothetical protein